MLQYRSVKQKIIQAQDFVSCGILRYIVPEPLCGSNFLGQKEGIRQVEKKAIDVAPSDAIIWEALR